jgi:tRNA(Ile2) C34 agmatinyltransferase TiaS
MRSLTPEQQALHPACSQCGWRMGGVDSWDGTRCKCGKTSLSFRELFVAARETTEVMQRLTGRQQ